MIRCWFAMHFYYHIWQFYGFDPEWYLLLSYAFLPPYMIHGCSSLQYSDNICMPSNPYNRQINRGGGGGGGPDLCIFTMSYEPLIGRGSLQHSDMDVDYCSIATTYGPHTPHIKPKKRGGVQFTMHIYDELWTPDYLLCIFCYRTLARGRASLQHSDNIFTTMPDLCSIATRIALDTHLCSIATKHAWCMV